LLASLDDKIEGIRSVLTVPVDDGPRHQALTKCQDRLAESAEAGRLDGRPARPPRRSPIQHSLQRAPRVQRCVATVMSVVGLALMAGRLRVLA